MQVASQPLMVINEANFTQELRKKNRKEKINRLRRQGQLRFERVSDSAEFSAVFDELSLQYDFRKEAMFNRSFIHSDPLRKVFLHCLFEQGLLHTTLLKLDETIIASNVGVSGKNVVHLQGMNTHAPSYAKYSPGIIHFLMLGKQLADEGIAVFDLTPGADAYKSSLATGFVIAHQLEIVGAYSKIIKGLKFIVKEQLKKAALVVGLKPQVLKKVKWQIRFIRVKLAENKKEGVYHFIKLLFKSTAGAKVIRIFEGSSKGKQAEGVEVKINSLSDLLGYAPCRLDPTRWEFLSEAMRRLEGGESCYTWSDGGSLLGCAWLAGPRTSVPGEVPEGTAVLQGLYLHAAGVGRQGDFLKAVAARLEGPVYVVAGAALQRALTEEP